MCVGRQDWVVVAETKSGADCRRISGLCEWSSWELLAMTESARRGANRWKRP